MRKTRFSDKPYSLFVVSEQWGFLIRFDQNALHTVHLLISLFVNAEMSRVGISNVEQTDSKEIVGHGKHVVVIISKRWFKKEQLPSMEA